MDIDSSKFERSAKKYLDDIAEQIFKDLAGAGQEIRNYSALKSPVDTGALRAGWQTRSRRTPNGGEVEVFNPVPYAGFVEYGTRRQRAQPMLRPAINKVLPKLKERIRRYGK